MPTLKDRWRNFAGPVDAAERHIVEVVDKATSEMNINPDWEANMNLVDIINTDPNAASYERVFRTLRRRLAKGNAKVQILSLTLLETCVKNTGSEFRTSLAGSDFWEEVLRMADPKRKADLQVQDKILILVEDCAHALPDAGYKSAYDSLNQSGVRFPVRGREEIGAGFSLPPSNQDATAIRGAAAASGVGGMEKVSEEDQRAIEEAMRDLSSQPPPPAPGPAPPQVTYGPIATEPESKEKLQADLRVASNSLELLKDALGSIPLNEPELVYQDYIKDLSQQCAVMAPRLQKLIESASDETLLAGALALNDEMGTVLHRHTEMVKKAEASKMPVAAEEPSLLALDNVLPVQSSGNGASSSQVTQPVDAFSTLASSGTAYQPPPAAPLPVPPTTAVDPFDLLAAEGTQNPAPVQQPPPPPTQQNNQPRKEKDPFEDLISL